MEEKVNNDLIFDEGDKKFIANAAQSQERNIRVFNDTKKKAPEFTGETLMIYPPKNIVLHKLSQSPRIQVKSHDPLILYYNVISQKGAKTLLCYNTCNTNRGASAKHGSQHIEAEIIRRSNLLRALSTVDNKLYPLKPGTMIKFDDVRVFKNSKYKYLPDSGFSVDLLGLVLPKAPDSITIGDHDRYYRDADKECTKTIINNVINIANVEQYNTIIFHEIGEETNSRHPRADFLEILKDAFQASEAKNIFICLDKGGLDKDTIAKRDIYKTYCKNIDNVNPDNHSDCESSNSDDSDKEDILPLKRYKHLKKVFDKNGSMVTAKDVVDNTADNSDEDFDDNKSIHYASSDDEN
uniref:Uncharacterized protein n=1 Tax=viral metagenome TaxID=1070528 RepID=A0A6C0BBM6_9ZZZZ